jgi:hypothetical protein
MGNHHDHHPADIDSHMLEASRNFWDSFTKALTMGVIGVIIVLALMAVFLV